MMRFNFWTAQESKRRRAISRVNVFLLLQLEWVGWGSVSGGRKNEIVVAWGTRISNNWKVGWGLKEAFCD